MNRATALFACTILAAAAATPAEPGRPFRQISTMLWEDGWPRVGALP